MVFVADYIIDKFQDLRHRHRGLICVFSVDAAPPPRDSEARRLRLASFRKLWGRLASPAAVAGLPCSREGVELNDGDYSPAVRNLTA